MPVTTQPVSDRGGQILRQNRSIRQLFRVNPKVMGWVLELTTAGVIFLICWCVGAYLGSTVSTTTLMGELGCLVVCAGVSNRILRATSNQSDRKRRLLALTVVFFTLDLLIAALASIVSISVSAFSAIVALALGTILVITASLLGERLRAVFGCADDLLRRVAIVEVSRYQQAYRMWATSRSEMGFELVGVYSDDERRLGIGKPTTETVDDLVLRSRWDRIDAIVVRSNSSSHQDLLATLRRLQNISADIYVDHSTSPATERVIDWGYLNSIDTTNFFGLSLGPWKTLQGEFLDYSITLFLMILFMPLMLFIAVLIKLDSPGPVLFYQLRRGVNNSSFRIFKFRTIYHHLRDSNTIAQVTAGDMRVTRVGRFLRASSLDEIPQLLNVLRGEMALVGPRPHAHSTKAGDKLFCDAVPDYLLRYRVKPGMTGWAQVNGCRGETPGRRQIEERVRHDLYSIKNWSVGLYLKTLTLTALQVFKPIFARGSI